MTREQATQTACAGGRAPRRTTGTSLGSRPPSRGPSLRRRQTQAAAPASAASFGCYLRLMELRSQAAFALFRTGTTLVARTRYGLSHIHGIAEAVATTFLSMSAHALARAESPTTVSALSIWALSALSLSSSQLTLPLGTMFFPLNTGSIIVCGSAKSLSHPTLGQISGSLLGTAQNFENIVSRVVVRKLTWKPSFWRLFSTTCAAAFWLPALSATIVIFGPLYFPFEKPAFFR